jgi:hypothetical protein
LPDEIEEQIGLSAARAAHEQNVLAQDVVIDADALARLLKQAWQKNLCIALHGWRRCLPD